MGFVKYVQASLDYLLDHLDQVPNTVIGTEFEESAASFAKTNRSKR